MFQTFTLKSIKSCQEILTKPKKLGLSWIGNLNIIKISILPKLINSIQSHTKAQQACFFRYWQAISEIYIEIDGQNNFDKEQR